MERFITHRCNERPKATDYDKNGRENLNTLSFRAWRHKSTYPESRCAVACSRYQTTMTNDTNTIERSTNKQESPVSPTWRQRKSTVHNVKTPNTGESGGNVITRAKKIFFGGGRDYHEKNFFFGVEDATTVSTQQDDTLNHRNQAVETIPPTNHGGFSAYYYYYYYYYCHQYVYNTYSETAKENSLSPGWRQRFGEEVVA